MAMTYSSLIAPKGTSGSIANFAAYTRLDLPPVVDEAQALLYELLRVREMMTQYLFRATANTAWIALPARFLDPIGRIFCPTLNKSIRHTDESDVTRGRTYTTTSGDLGAAPFTTTSGSALVSVHLSGHGFTQASAFTSSGAVAVNGVTPNGTFPVASITDADNFVIDTSILGTTASGSGSGGGSSATYVCDILVAIYFERWAIWDERIQFDGPAQQDVTGVLNYYQSLPLLAATTNESNFITNRYPNVMRKACMAAAADFMDDTENYQRQYTELAALVARINVENDGFRRGAEIDMETP